MENPYNPEEREEIDYLWDRAYYDGKYYSYFGITPIITVMFPFYLLSGMLPAPLLVQFIYMLIFAIFFPKLVMMLLDKYSERTSSALKIVLTYIAYLSSFDLLIGRGKNTFYFIASTAAIAFLTWFAYLFFKGIYTENHKKRCIYFLAAGLMFSLSFHARVIKAFTGVFFIVPVVIFYLILGKQTWKKKLIELGCLSFFVVIGFGLMGYLYGYFMSKCFEPYLKQEEATKETTAEDTKMVADEGKSETDKEEEIDKEIKDLEIYNNKGVRVFNYKNGVEIK